MTPALRYGTAALLVLGSTVGLTAVGRVLAVERAPFLLFTPAVFVAAAVGGLGPGLFATVLGALSGEAALIWAGDPYLRTPDLLRLLLFATIGSSISVMAGHLREARATAERHARDAERRAAELEALFEVSPVGLARADDPACRRISVNRSLATRLGMAEADNASLGVEPDARPPYRVTTADGTPIATDDLPLQLAARTLQPVVDAQVAVMRDDGGVVVMQAHAVPLLDEHGAARGAIGVFNDISEQRRSAEEQRFLADASRRLSTSLDYEETLRRVARLAAPGMADWAVFDVVDADGHLTRHSSVHRDAAAQAWLEERPTLSADGSGAAALTLAVFDGPTLVRQVDDRVLRSLGAAQSQIDSTRPLGVTSALVVPLTLHGATVGAFAWMRGGNRMPFDERDLALAEEVGRRAAMAIEHARLYREAQSANRQKDEFVATLSHELRTPLNAMLGWTDLLRSGHLSPERQRDALEAVHRTALAQSQLTNDLVDVSRVVSGKFRMRPQKVDVARVVCDATEGFRLAAESKGLRLECHLAPALPHLVADPDRVQQIVYNLVGNAVKFTASGGVDVTARADADWLVLSVRDSGIGIKPSFLPYVFDRFRQADGSVTREFGGLGLGLSIVRALVELHGGTVAAASEGDGRGATFTVRLPLASPASRQVTDAMRFEPIA